MTIQIRLFTEELSEAVASFNCRLGRSGVSPELRFPEQPSDDASPHCAASKEQKFLALEDGCVRGGYILRFQSFSIFDVTRSVGQLRLPLSEGIVDRAYMTVGVHILRHLVRNRHPLYALGMGGLSATLPKMLNRLGWTERTIPFRFCVNRVNRFLEQIQALRCSAWRRALLDVAASTGMGWTAIKAMQCLYRTNRPGSAKLEIVPSFAEWADRIWEQSHGEYAMIACREAEALNTLYTLSDPKFLRLRVSQAGSVVGWAVLLDSQMRESKYFGSLRVGSIVDCLSLPGKEDVVAQKAYELLEDRGVDLTISNQASHRWVRALRNSGFLAGPSNFALAASPQLQILLGAGNGWVNFMSPVGMGMARFISKLITFHAMSESEQSSARGPELSGCCV